MTAAKDIRKEGSSTQKRRMKLKCSSSKRDFHKISFQDNKRDTLSLLQRRFMVGCRWTWWRWTK
jgi:hypothetical protein